MQMAKPLLKIWKYLEHVKELKNKFFGLLKFACRNSFSMERTAATVGENFLNQIC
jgi:hypothetical protein